MTQEGDVDRGGRIHWRLLMVGILAQALSAYDDVIRSPLLPAIARDLGLAFTESSWFLITGQAAATLTAFGLVRMLRRAGERQVIFGLLAVALVTAATAPLVHRIHGLLALGMGLGVVAAGFGTMASLIAVDASPPSLEGRTLAGLHSIFGVGSMIASGGVAVGLGLGLRWSTFIAASLPIIGLLLAFGYFYLPRRPHLEPDQQLADAAAINREPLNRTQLFLIGLFAVYVAGEVTASSWMTTYLNRELGVTIERAAGILGAYYLVLTLTRLACAALLKPAAQKPILVAALVAPIVALLVARATGVGEVLALVGALGPFFPVMVGCYRRWYPKAWRDMTVWSIFAMNIALVIMNGLLGWVADRHGIAIAYWIPVLLIGIALAGLLSFLAMPTAAGKALQQQPAT